MQLKDNWGPGDKITSIPASWFNAVAAFINTFSVRGVASLHKPDHPTEADPVVVDVPEAQVSALNPGSTVVDLGIKSGGNPYEGLDANNTSTWNAGGENGLKMLIVTRVFFDHSAGTPILKAFCREMIIDKNGIIYAVGPEANYEIDTPVAGY